MNFHELKSKAKEIIKTSKPSAITVGLLFILISTVFSALSNRVLTSNITAHDAELLYRAYEIQDYDYVLSFASKLQPTVPGALINLAIEAVMVIVSAGFVIFLLNTVRKTGAAAAGNLLDGFANPVKLILLSLLEGVLISLQCMLLIVPGIIAAFAYSQALYILLDNPEKGVMQCLKESRQMMKGHKWELFRLDLSFLGWLILSAIVMPVEIWTTPYISTTRVLYYENLRGAEYCE